MRFFISADIKRNKALYYAVLAFLIFSLLFWIASWISFYGKYGLSYESLFKYYFMDPEFPQKISIAQISEDIHINLFLHGLMLLTLLSIFNLFGQNQSLKLFIIFSSNLFALFYIGTDLLIFLFEWPKLLWLKLFSFIVYQLLLLFVILYNLYCLILKDARPPKTKALRYFTFLFSVFFLLFLLSNFLNFFSKMGFGIEGIKDYYLGNPSLFIKPKTFQGVFKVFYPHLLTMALFSLILAHLLPFAGFKKKRAITLGFSVFLFSFLDNLSSLLILFIHYFAYLKLLSFWAFQLTAILLSLYVLVFSLRKEEYPAMIA